MRVVIVGAGFGGIACAKALKGADVEVVLIDRTNHHLFQPLLYQVASAALSPSDIATPIRQIMRRQKNCTVVMSDVLSIDKEKKRVHLSDADPIAFDLLVIAVGARHSYFNNAHWEEAAPGLKTLEEAVFLREKILTSFEIAERALKKSEREKWLNFVIVGGGPTGVELAGAIAEIAYKTMLKDFKQVDINQTKVFLVEAAPYILPGFHPSLSERAKKDLEKLGVQVLVNTRVLNVEEEGVEIYRNELKNPERSSPIGSPMGCFADSPSGAPASTFPDSSVHFGMEERSIPTKNVIWAAGNQASSLLKTLGIPLDKQGRVCVEKDLSIPNYPDIFVIGDAACLIGKDGKPIPALAPAAAQEGKFVAQMILKNKREPFIYFDKGMMATIGVYKAVASIGPFAFSGFLAWLAWCFIHIAFLINFRSRFFVLLNWLWWLISGTRSSRLITRPMK